MNLIKPKVFPMLLIISLSLVTSMSFAKICSLHPDGFDGSAKSMSKFEDNIAAKMTSYYRQDYPDLKKLLGRYSKLENRIKGLERKIIRAYGPSIGGNPKFSQKRRVKRMRYSRDLRKLLLEENMNQAALDAFHNKHPRGKLVPLSELVEVKKYLDNYRAELEGVSKRVKSIKAPRYPYAPRAEFNIRSTPKGLMYVYGNLQAEAFLRPPAKNLLKFPLVNAGFETDETTVVYFCVNTDAYDKKKNHIYIYFLKTTKFWASGISDYISNPALSIRNFFTQFMEPEAIIAPITLTFDPVTGLLGPLDFLFENIGILKPFQFLNTFLQKMGVVSIAMSPVQEFVMAVANIGIKGIHIKEDKYRVRYGGSTFFHLVQFDIATQSGSGDFSPYVGRISQPSFQKIPYADLKDETESKENAKKSLDE